MSVYRQTSVIAALSSNGLGAALTSTGASYVLTANSAADSLAHLITIKNNSATDHSGKTMAITGTDANGRPLTQTITGPAGSATVTSTAYFQTVTSVVPSASTGADTFDIGWTAGAITPSFMVNLNHALPINIGIGSTVVSGSPNYTLQYTFDNSAWFDDATITGKTASFAGGFTLPVYALRMKYTVAGSVNHTYIQHDKFGQ